MSYNSIVYRVMIASPSDITSERIIIREVLSEWNTINSFTRKIVLLPVGWETHSTPTMGDRAQSIINKDVLKDCDLLVGVFWTRIGTATGEYDSGTIEEIEKHMKAGKPTMIYFSNAPVHPDSVNAEQYDRLKNFKKSCQERGLYEIYDNFNDFKDKFNRQLQIKLYKDEYFKTSVNENSEIFESTIPSIPKLTLEAKILLKETSKDYSGMILRLFDSAGFTLQTNSNNLVKDRSAKQRAIWEAAIKELEDNGLINAQNYKRETFMITRKGYEIAELLDI